jgi:sphingolipid 8-(E)-desaturase
MMKYFTIGRINEEWVNFIPPVQGGKFEPEPEDEGIVIEDSSSGDEDSVDSQVYIRNPPLNTLRPASGDLPSEFDQYPPLNPGVQHQITLKYRELDKRLWKEGYYECHYSRYLPEIFRYTTLAILSYIALRYNWYCTSALFLGLMWHQLVFTAHDSGHMGITHDPVIDTTIGILIADFIGGLSIGWWKKNHNVHHIVTNDPEHDPDIQHMPFFAVSPRFLQSLRSTYYDRVMTYNAVASVMIKIQHWMYYPVLCFGRFNLYRLSWEHLILAKGVPKTGITQRFRILEIIGNVVFWYWFGYLLLYRSIPTAGQRMLYVLISHVVTMPLHVQITLSHFGMSTTDFGPAESFPQKMLRTTMDVDCPPFLDFIHGGLQFQAVHHLFPRVPRHRLREVQPLVREFCESVGVKYVIFGFVEGNKEVIGRLGEVAKQARAMKECVEWLATEGKD